MMKGMEGGMMGPMVEDVAVTAAEKSAGYREPFLTYSTISIMRETR
jgi:hypothetical protein